MRATVITESKKAEMLRTANKLSNESKAQKVWTRDGMIKRVLATIASEIQSGLDREAQAKKEAESKAESKSAKRLKAKTEKAELAKAKKAFEKKECKEAEAELTAQQVINLRWSELLTVDKEMLSDDAEQSAIAQYMSAYDETQDESLIYPLAGMILKAKLRFLCEGHSKSMSKADVDNASQSNKRTEVKSARVINYEYSRIYRNAYNSLCKGKPNYDAEDMLNQVCCDMLSDFAEYGSLSATVTISRKSDKVRAFYTEAESKEAESAEAEAESKEAESAEAEAESTFADRQKAYAVGVKAEYIPVSKLVFRQIGDYIRGFDRVQDSYGLFAETEDGETYKLDKIQSMLTGSTDFISFERVLAVDKLISELVACRWTNKQASVIQLRLSGYSIAQGARKLGITEQCFKEHLQKAQKAFLQSKLADKYENVRQAMDYCIRDQRESKAELSATSTTFKQVEFFAELNGEIVCTSDNVRGCARYLSERYGKKVDAGNISKCLKGRAKQTAGFTFGYFPVESISRGKSIAEMLAEMVFMDAEQRASLSKQAEQMLSVHRAPQLVLWDCKRLEASKELERGAQIVQSISTERKLEALRVYDAIKRNRKAQDCTHYQRVCKRGAHKDYIWIESKAVESKAVESKPESKKRVRKPVQVAQVWRSVSTGALEVRYDTKMRWIEQ